jgi:UDPglucose--hexose-1-phosphate uridylyltransferase
METVLLGAGVSKHTTSLADGRELIYYDDANSTVGDHRAVDERELDPRPPTASMRQDVLTGDWIAVAAGRQNRVFLPPAHQDPLAPQAPGNPSEVPGNYDVVVFENRSPSFGPEVGHVDVTGLGLGRTVPAYGRCEVVCFDPATEGSIAQLPESRVRTVIEAWADRTAALSAMPGIEQVFPFENRGEQIGVTLHHPHGQIYSYPFVTPRTAALVESVTAMPTLFADILAFEQAGERVVLAGEHFTAFVPFAARWPIEVHLLPHRQVPDLAALNDAERDELAVLYRRLLRGIDALYSVDGQSTPTPYIAAWHQAPVHEFRDEIRLMLQITSPRRAVNRLKYLAGSEAAMGAWVGDIVPERTAEFIREGIDRG